MRSILKSMLIVLGAVIAGCSTYSPSLPGQNIFELEIIETQPLSIGPVSVYRQDSKTVIRGEAAFPPWVEYGIFRGHMDVKITSPDGKVIEKNELPLVRRRIPKKRGRRAFFVTHLPSNLAPRTVIELKYHDGDHVYLNRGNGGHGEDILDRALVRDPWAC